MCKLYLVKCLTFRPKAEKSCLSKRWELWSLFTFSRHYELYAVAVACLQLFRESNYTGRQVGAEGTAAKEAVDRISVAEESVVAREGLLSMGGEDVEEVVVARGLLHFALSVFKRSEFNICSKTWVSTSYVIGSVIIQGGRSLCFG